MKRGTVFPREKSSQKDSLISYAENGDLIKVQELLKAGAAPSVNAFIASAGVGSWELFELLFNRCQQNVPFIDINARETGVGFKAKVGNTALHEAARDNNRNMVEKLLANGARVNRHVGFYKGPALSLAIQNGHIDVVKVLLKAGSNVNQAEKRSGCTPLYLAAEEGHLAVMLELLASGAGSSINAPDIYGSTPLSRSARRAYLDTLQVLIENGACINTRDRYGRTPIYLCATNEGIPPFTVHQRSHVKALKALIAAGADIKLINDPDLKGRTPLSKAAKSGDIEVVKILLKAGAAVNILDEWQVSALNRAATMGELKVVKVLLFKGALVQSVDRWGRTPLSKAAEQGHEEVVSELVAAGASVNTKDDQGNTPLHLSAQSSLSMATLLVRQGANYEVTNKIGHTPYNRCPSLVLELNWYERKGLALLTAALKQYWQHAEIKDLESRSYQKVAFTRKFLCNRRFHKHVSSFLGVNESRGSVSSSGSSCCCDGGDTVSSGEFRYKHTDHPGEFDFSVYPEDDIEEEGKCYDLDFGLCLICRKWCGRWGVDDEGLYDIDETGTDCWREAYTDSCDEDEDYMEYLEELRS